MDSATYLERCMEGSGAGGILKNHLSLRSWERYDLSSLEAPSSAPDKGGRASVCPSRAIDGLSIIPEMQQKLN
ncbi:hypothetical protein CDAR_427961 [Caerostris darwini]|uniref:Uncharacterized protein n=1 Tax=Caerostris darwini TaxID=1538125 RepID=A0AAV4UBV4_9ARAC|nr:hypothetical protein CDAR_427961 [Caerostris darwini]